MINNQDSLLGPIKTIVAEELPCNYTAEINLAFDSLCEGQEESFRLVQLSWNEKVSDINKAKVDAGWADWTHRITEKIHRKYGKDSLLISYRMPACRIK